MVSVLLVDDSKFSCKRQAEMLREVNPEFEVEMRFLPSEVITIVNEDDRNFDLIFLDFNMPEYNGLELAEILKDKIPYEKMVLITATSAFTTKSKELPEGMRIIQKPLSIEKLQATLSPIELKRGA